MSDRSLENLLVSLGDLVQNINREPDAKEQEIKNLQSTDSFQEWMAVVASDDEQKPNGKNKESENE